MWRKAEAIDLHDAATRISLAGHESFSACHPGRSEYGKKYQLGDDVLKDVAEQFGIDIPLSRRTNTGTDGKRNWSRFEVPHVWAFYEDYLEGIHANRVERLDCEIVAANMVNVRVTTSELSSDGSTGEVTAEWTEEFTYCGSFTVWWAEPDSEETHQPPGEQDLIAEGTAVADAVEETVAAFSLGSEALRAITADEFKTSHAEEDMENPMTCITFQVPRALEKRARLAAAKLGVSKSLLGQVALRRFLAAMSSDMAEAAATDDAGRAQSEEDEGEETADAE